MNNGESYDKRSPKIGVVGIGGGGVNSLKNILHDLKDKLYCNFIFVALNTDAQSLKCFKEEEKYSKYEKNISILPIQLGPDGLGAGANPEKGQSAAEYSLEEVKEALKDCNMIIITTGLGGGTGSGATHVIANMLKHELGKIVIIILTQPFNFEGEIRKRIANEALEKCLENSDLVVKIANQNLFEIINTSTSIKDAFKIVDQVCSTFVRGILDIVENTGLVNLDFADICAIVKDGGIGVIGVGEGVGENAANIAIEKAIKNQLFDIYISEAQSALVHIVGNSKLSLLDVEAIVNETQKKILTSNSKIIYGAAIEEEKEDEEKKIRVMIIAVMPNVQEELKNFKTKESFEYPENRHNFESSYVAPEKDKDIFSSLIEKWTNL